MATRWLFILVGLAVGFGGIWGVEATAQDASNWLYIGTYTGGGSEGIYVSKLDSKTGALAKPELAAEIKNPSFVAVHPNRKFLYAVSEVADAGGKPTGGVAAFAIDDKTGKLTLLNQQSSEGTGPCHLVVDRAGKNVLVANYGGGSCASLPIGDDGKLGPATSAIQHQGKSVNAARQEAPHAHSINLDAANRFAFVADLGLDQVLVYKFDSKSGKLTPNDPPFTKVAAGAGPRHFAFLPNGKAAYVINELASSVTVFSYDAEKGVLKELQNLSTLPGDVPGNSTAEVVVHPSGNFVYGSNRGHNSLAIFAVDPATGKLTAKGNQGTGGKIPRNFAIDPTGKWLLAENQESGTIVVFAIDSKTGQLAQTGKSVEVASPVCVRFR